VSAASPVRGRDRLAGDRVRHTLRAALCALGTGVVCSAAYAADLRVRVEDESGMALRNAVVYATPTAPHARLATGYAVIDQIQRQFVPRDTVVQSGTTIAFPNSDNIHHSVYSFSPARTFTPLPPEDFRRWVEGSLPQLRPTTDSPETRSADLSETMGAVEAHRSRVASN